MNSSLLTLLHFPSSWSLNPVLSRSWWGGPLRRRKAPFSSDLNTLELMTYLVFFQPREVWASWLSLEAWQGETVPGNPLRAVTINLGSLGSRVIGKQNSMF